MLPWLTRVSKVGSMVLRPMLDILYPPSCLACRGAVGEAGALCPACWRRMRFIERPFCERLGTPFAQDLGPGLLSPQAMAEPPVWSRARAVCAFDEGPARLLVHRLKYNDRLDLSAAMGRWMARAGLDLLEEADELVPVPLHRRRLASRRYNQAALLARVISEHSGVPCSLEGLIRIKATPPQVGLSRLQRAANMQGAFRVPEGSLVRIRDRRIVLVDDVLTSGATTNAAARALRRAGAANVDVLTFGRVVLDA